MNEKLQDKVVAIELAGNNIFIANDNDNFKNELISIGFEKVEPDRKSTRLNSSHP